ncbi:Short-chain dehydrogenase, chloroplastic [Sesamum angolense]|uniref:Short-chain dehydrogenase, chloroplastic n=1 Tax=Sesamum angolense TaxID=2727404 RepID=A0AAE1W4H2_9LAMI|nr:Short-chain dehydrogenase, chloroplastic [Sesamum angolense]
MSVLWTLSLVFSYLKLFSHGFLSPKSNVYSRRTPKHSTFANTAVTRPVCIITGATSGLGAAAAYALLVEGFYVVLVEDHLKLLSKVISDIKSQNQDACLKGFEVNLASFKSILEFNQSLQQWLRDSNLHSSVQLLINNAGILATSRRLTSEGYDQMLATNYIGAFCVTKVLLPLLENSPVPSRVVNVTSFTHWNGWQRNCIWEEFYEIKYTYAHIYEYSKLCLLLFSYELHRQINLKEISSSLCCSKLIINQEASIFCTLDLLATDPGAVKTNIMREIPSCVSQMAFIVLKFLGLLQSSKTGVCSILDAALAPPEVSGVYFFGGNGRSLNSSPLSYDANLAKELWATSCNCSKNCSWLPDWASVYDWIAKSLVSIRVFSSAMAMTIHHFL